MFLVMLYMVFEYKNILSGQRMQKVNALLIVVLGRRGENPITADRINQGVREGMENIVLVIFYR